MKWAPELEERLRELWAEGHSTAEIGRLMGMSKNAIVGRAHRMQLPSRPSPILRGAAGAPKVRADSRRKASSNTLPPLPTAALPAEQYVDGNRRRATASIPNRAAVRGPTLVTGAPPPVLREPKPEPRRSRGTCCWPLWGANERPTHRYCEAMAEVGAYCREHAAIGYMLRPSVAEAA